MSHHLSDHELSTAMAGLELPTAAAEHLRSCLSCRSLVTEFELVVEGRRTEQAKEEPDWTRQRGAILERLAEARMIARPQRRAMWRPIILAAAAALVLAVGVGSLVRTADHDPAVVAENGFQVEELLAEVDALLADDSIPGLWPADPLTDNNEVESLITKDAS